MASIGISATSDNQFNISMDNNEWTGLTVNGEAVPGNGHGWSYTGPGPLTFEATASGIETIAENRVLAVKGTGSTCYVASLAYTDPSKPFAIEGSLYSADNVNGAVDKQVWFSQGGMMGAFNPPSK